MSKTIDLEQIPVIKELVEAAIDEKTTPLEDEIEDIKKNGDRVHRFLLYDWDDTLIGVVAVPMGYDPRPYINKYVEENLIHPQLRNQTAEQLASRERTDNYRGEYPHTGPDENDPLRTGGADTVEDGGDYPLTNHLEYCFMGKDLDPDYPYVSGWTEVTPENMADTFTALSTQSDGTVAATEFGPAPVDGETAPRIVQFDWTQFISGGGYANPVTVRIKACYKEGTDIDGGGDGNYYCSLPNIEESVSQTLFLITVIYKRINKNGYGVVLPYNLVLVDNQEYGGYSSASVHRVVSYDRFVYTANVFEWITFHNTTLITVPAGCDINNGGTRGADEGTAVRGMWGISFRIRANKLLDCVNDGASVNRNMFSVIELRRSTNAAVIATQIQINSAVNAIRNLIDECTTAGDDYKTLTWFQIQYAILQSEAPYYTDDTTAGDWIYQYDALAAVADEYQ